MGWPCVELREVLQPDLVPVRVNPAETYEMVGVYSFGRGLFRREPVHGSKTSYKFFYRLKANHFVMSQLFGWEGALALSSSEFCGLYVSPQFPTFLCNEQRLDRRFLGWIARMPSLWNDLGGRTRGMGDRRRTLTPEALLICKIPLPPLNEQCGIVSRIDQLAKKVTEAHRLRRETLEKTENIMATEELELWPNGNFGNPRTLHEVTTFLARGRRSGQGPSDHYLVKTQHVQLGRYVETNITLAAHEAARVHPEAMVQPGDVLIACSAAGCLGRVAFYQGPQKPMSTDTHVAIARANPEVLNPEYLYYYLKGAQGQFQLRSREKGDWKREKIGFRLTELNVADMRRVPIPMLPLPEQRKIVAYLRGLQEKVESTKKLQSETAAELEALMLSILSKAFRGEL